MSSDPVIAGPLTDCCFTGFKHSGEPLGERISLGNVETYLSTPKRSPADESKTKVILYFTDINGPFYVNNQLIQDYFAAHGFVVLGPDYFFGNYVLEQIGKPGFDRVVWRDNAVEAAKNAIPGWLNAVKEKYGADAQYSAVGYCFGAPFAMELAATGVLVAAAIAHPSSLQESHLEQLKAPLLLSCAEVDNSFPAEFRHRAEDILVKNKATYYFQIFSGVSHGFAVRGDPAVEHIREFLLSNVDSIFGIDLLSRRMGEGGVFPLWSLDQVGITRVVFVTCFALAPPSLSESFLGFRTIVTMSSV